MEEFTEAFRYKKVKDKVNNIRIFYIHLVLYFLVNIIVGVLKINRNLNNGETLQEAIFDFATIGVWLIWGIVILCHAFFINGFDYIFGKNWEIRKLQEIIQEEDRILNQKE